MGKRLGDNLQEEIRRLHNSGKSNKDIEIILGLSPKTVSKYIERKFPEPISVDEINSYIELGSNITELSKKFNFSRTKMYQVLKDNNLDIQKNKPNLEYIADMYLKEKLSAKKIGEKIGKSESTVLRYLKSEGIEIKRIRKNKPQKKQKTVHISYDELYDLYLIKNLTSDEIAKIFNISKSTVKNKIKKYKISKDTKKKINLELLRELYVNESLSTSEISEATKLSTSTILRRIKEFNLEHEAEEKRKNEKNILLDKILNGSKISESIKGTNISYYDMTSFLKDNQIELPRKKVGRLAKKYDVPDNVATYYFSNFFDNDLGNAENFLRNYSSGETKLEIAAKEILGLEQYNCFFDLNRYPELRYRPDFKLNDMTGINVDGLYWHSELNLDKKYHFNMRKEYEKRGLRIFQFREDEVNLKPDIIRSIIQNNLGNSIKIGARKTFVVDIEQKVADTFYNANHLMGTIKAKHIGLIYGDELVMLLSWKEYVDKVKIERLSSKIGYLVVGGFSKLMKNQNFTKDIHYWVDLRYGSGNFLLKQGFRKERETLGWKWTDFKNTYNRLQCRANMDNRKLSQAEHAKELGLVKIYDAGQRLYVRRKENESNI